MTLFVRLSPSDFEDMSCEMVYGQVPPPFEEDPVAKQPCFSEICKFCTSDIYTHTDIYALCENVMFIFLLTKVLSFAGSMANPSSSVCPKLQA